MPLLSDVSQQVIEVAARDSALSRAQVEEVLKLLQRQLPSISFETTWISTIGDKDLLTSLRSLDRTDFFTRELDEAVRERKVRVAIHSAKDLPVPLHPSLTVVALTECLDPRDMLVYGSRYSNSKLPKKPIIGTSSLRREEAVKMAHPDAIIKDIRGSIVSRLEQLDRGDYDAVVMPECALIRLGLLHRRRQELHCETAPLQGQLAVTARADDIAMEQLFSCIDTRE